MPRSLRIVLTLLAILAIAVAAASARVAEGPVQLDTGFGKHGLVSDPDAAPGFEEVAATAVPGGTIYVAAESSEQPGTAVIARYWRDGALEISFGERGYATLANLGPVNALATDGAGRLIVLSRRTTITKLTTAGEPDPSFGSDGSVEMADLGLGDLHLWSLASLTGGGVAAAGITFGAPQMTVVQLGPDGSLDPSFNRGSSATVDFGPGINSGAFALRTQPDGKLLIGGYAASRPALARLMADGTTDRGFGRGGRVLSPRLLHGRITALAARPDGSILAGVSGSTRRGLGFRAMLLRYSASGRLDWHFGAVADPGSRSGSRAIPIAVMEARRHVFLATRGRGPSIRAYRPNGRPQALGRVTGLPMDRLFPIAAAPQRGKLVVAWTPKHAPGQGVVKLARFLLR
jgi:uncharacterized delta-60 repeat protein